MNINEMKNRKIQWKTKDDEQLTRKSKQISFEIFKNDEIIIEPQRIRVFKVKIIPL